MSDRPLFAAEFFNACTRGFDQLSTEAQDGMREAVVAAQAEDGLFVGRHPAGDLYYTFFGLLLAAVMRAKIRLDACKRAVEAIDFFSLDLVHGCVWLRARRLLKLLALPGIVRGTAATHISAKADNEEREQIRRLGLLSPDAFPQSDPFAPYSRFLLTTLHADFGVELPATDLHAYRLESGLYANLQNDPACGVNATASALFLIPAYERQKTLHALCALQQEDGSFKAVENAPCGDLLSTGTAFFALHKYDQPPRHSAKPFLRDCIRVNGLFAATPDDPCGDLEYTVYALLSLGGSA